jgi:hypothetical protein
MRTSSLIRMRWVGSQGQTMKHKYEGKSANGSKTVIDVIDFLCVSLGSSTVHLHDCLGIRRACACSEAGFSSQNGHRAWVYYWRAAFRFAFFCGQKDSIQRIFIKKFAVYGRKCLLRKTVHNWVDKFSQGRSKVADVARPGAELAETTVERLPYCRFRPLMGHHQVLIHLKCQTCCASTTFM